MHRKSYRHKGNKAKAFLFLALPNIGQEIIRAVQFQAQSAPRNSYLFPKIF